MNVTNAPKRASSREPEMGQAELERIFGGPVNFGPARTTERQRLFHGKFAEHLWCGCCKRTFPNGIFRQVGEFRRCPYADCTGHASVDAMPWERIKGGNPDYPNVPTVGIRYPQMIHVVPVQGLGLAL